jgi:hypothetical protein
MSQEMFDIYHTLVFTIHENSTKFALYLTHLQNFMESRLINKKLLSGPDTLNSLLGILLRFRRNNVAVACT